MSEMAYVAALQVFPAIAAFQRDLNQQLFSKGIVWGHPNRGVNLSSTTSLDKETDWWPGRVSFAWWSKSWGAQGGAIRGFYPGLYTCFDFKSAGIEVGVAVSTKSAGDANRVWQPQATELANELASLPLANAEVAIAESVLAHTRRAIPARDLRPLWLTNNLYGLTGSLLLYKRLPSSASVDDACALLLEVRGAVDDCRSLKNMLVRTH